MNTVALIAHPLGDSAITISFGGERSPELLARIHETARVLRSELGKQVEDIVPSYLAITIFYNGARISYAEMKARLLPVCERSIVRAAETTPRYEHVIPVHYDGIDLESVAASAGLTPEQVIELHSGRTYTVDLLGFVPGWAYLSELDPALQLPRRERPRERVAAGSVAIAGLQTGIYPLDTPGGWHIIGRTNVRPFDPRRDPPALFAAGDAVRFERV